MLTIKTTDGKDIAGFYSNWSGRVVMEPSATLYSGLYLKGVYLYKDNPYSDQTKSYNSNAYYVAASADGKIYLDLNRDLIINLMKKGAIGGATADATICFYPDYGRKTATVTFPNLGSDGNGTKFNNIDNCGLTKNGTNYQMTVPFSSVIRIGMTPAADRTAAGIKSSSTRSFRSSSASASAWRRCGAARGLPLIWISTLRATATRPTGT